MSKIGKIRSKSEKLFTRGRNANYASIYKDLQHFTHLYIIAALSGIIADAFLMMH